MLSHSDEDRLRELSAQDAELRRALGVTDAAQPLDIVARVRRLLGGRRAEATAGKQRLDWFVTMYEAYRDLDPESRQEVDQWQQEHGHMATWPGWAELIGQRPDK